MRLGRGSACTDPLLTDDATGKYVPQRPFRQSDITKAIKAMQAAGVQVHSVIIEPDGRIIVSTDKADVPVINKPNPWDAIFEGGR